MEPRLNTRWRGDVGAQCVCVVYWRSDAGALGSQWCLCVYTQAGDAVRRGSSNRRRGLSTAATVFCWLRPKPSLFGPESTVTSSRRPKYVGVVFCFRRVDDGVT